MTTTTTTSVPPAEVRSWRAYVRLYRTLGRHGVHVALA